MPFPRGAFYTTSSSLYYLKLAYNWLFAGKEGGGGKMLRGGRIACKDCKKQKLNNFMIFQYRKFEFLFKFRQLFAYICNLRLYFQF